MNIFEYTKAAKLAGARTTLKALRSLVSTVELNEEDIALLNKELKLNIQANKPAESDKPQIEEKKISESDKPQAEEKKIKEKQPKKNNVKE